MKSHNLHLLLSICLLLLLTACDKKQAALLDAKIYPDTDQRLWPYFAKFESEAARHNMPIDLNAINIRGSIQEIPVEDIVGLCNNSSENSNQVLIDEGFWNRSSDVSKEMIIFHELGHCVLQRSHLDETLDNGMCKSLMRSGFGDCITLYGLGDHEDYYLEELFSL